VTSIHDAGDTDFLPGFRLVNFRDAPPIREQPHACLIQWRVLLRPARQLHLIGFLPERPTIRVTTPVLWLREREAATSSGRRYTLVGDPGEDEEARTLFALRIAGLSCTDVTEAFWQLRGDPAAWCAARLSLEVQ